jgi:beta-glucanase (GH16 family)
MYTCLKSSFFFFLIYLCITGCNPKQPECPLPYGEWKFVPEWSDEFNGFSLDTSKWYPNNPGWLGRQPGYFSTENVKVKDGKLILTSKTETLSNLPEGYHTFTTAAVKSKALMLYGYYEICCKPMDSRCSSAFWFYAIEPDIWTEIDVFEICGKHPDPEMERKYFATTHVMKYPELEGEVHDHVEWMAPSRLADQYWTVGLEWNEKEIKWYVNGEVVRIRENTHWRQPLNMNFDSETMPEWFGIPDPANPEGHFEIDYIRVWKPSISKKNSLDKNRSR